VFTIGVNGKRKPGWANVFGGAARPGQFQNLTYIHYEVPNLTHQLEFVPLRNYLKTVTLSEAKGLAGRDKRFFAALRMTNRVLR